MKLRPYETKLVADVVADLSRSTDGLNEVVLAACPGAGKTIMSIAAIDRMLSAGTAKRILVLAHATTLLRSQYAAKLRSAARSFVFAEYLPRATPGHVALKDISAPVVVALPQSFARVKEPGKFDLVVVDEAHLYYGKPMVTEIVKRVVAARVLLLTGTPSPFVARGLKLHVASMQELYRDGKEAADGPWIADTRIKLLESKYDVSRRQYNADGEIRRGVRFPSVRTTETLDGLRSWLRSHTRSLKGWTELLRQIGKTMIVCRSQAVAAQSTKYFERAGVSVALSTSDTDAGGAEISRFMGDPSVQLLIVVCRANVGFDYPGLGALVDMTGTINIDRIFQMFARVVRPGDVAKMFVKLASADLFEYTKSIQKAALLLAGRDFYQKWNGRDLSGVRVPGADGESGTGAGGASRTARRRLPLIDDGFLMFEEFMKIETNDDGTLIAGTTLGALGFAIERKPGGKRRADLLAFYRDNNRPVSKQEDSALYSAQADFSSDPEVSREQARVGYPTQPKRLILGGQRFGRLRVVREIRPIHGTATRWLCRCDCGRTVEADGNQLRRGKPSSCGQHLAEMRRAAGTQCKPEDLTGRKFGLLMAIGLADSHAGGPRWNVRCACGAEKTVHASNLKAGRTQSCGCRGRELSSCKRSA